MLTSRYQRLSDRLGVLRNDKVRTVCSWHCTFHHQEMVLGIDLDNAEIPRRDPFLSHVPSRAHPLQNTRGECRRADRTRRPMEHGTVGRRPTSEMMSLYQPGETLSLADSRNINLIAG